MSAVVRCKDKAYHLPQGVGRLYRLSIALTPSLV